MDADEQPAWVRDALKKIKSSLYYDPETDTINIQAALEAQNKRLPAHDPRAVKAIERLKNAAPGPEKLEAMRNLGDVMGGAPDPDTDLFGWLSAVQPRSSRLGRFHYLDLLKKRREEGEDNDAIQS